MESQKRARVHKGHVIGGFRDALHQVPFPLTLILADSVVDSRSLSRRCVEASKFENTHMTRRARTPCAKLLEVERSD
jgi:hypothetical protein